MKKKEKTRVVIRASIRQIKFVPLFILMLLAASQAAFSQAPPEQPPSDAEAIQHRIARARALAAAHNLGVAVNELNAIRKECTDQVTQDVARVLLMSVYLEEADYKDAQSLLDETFKAPEGHNETALRSYFALAGQAMNGARAHVERYRSMGVNPLDKDLPAESVNDIELLRQLLERMVEQARQISDEDVKCSDAAAFLEDVINARTALARNDEERQKWQTELRSARERLADTETRIVSVSATLSTTAPAAKTLAANNIPSPLTTAAKPVSNNAAASVSLKDTNTIAKDTNNVTKDKSEPDVKVEASAKPVAVASEKQIDANQLNKPMNVGSLLDKATQKVSPSYPSTAKTARITGVVTVRLVVDESGSVSAVESTSGPALLRQAAMDAARRWKFRPTIVEGQPVRVSGFISFNFAL